MTTTEPDDTSTVASTIIFQTKHATSLPFATDSSAAHLTTTSFGSEVTSNAGATDVGLTEQPAPTVSGCVMPHPSLCKYLNGYLLNFHLFLLLTKVLFQVLFKSPFIGLNDTIALLCSSYFNLLSILTLNYGNKILIILLFLIMVL